MTQPNLTDDGAEAARALIRQIEGDGVPPWAGPEVDPAVLLRRFPALSLIAVRDVEIVGPHGPVSTRVYDPAELAGPAFVWVHGGAFVAGDLAMYEANWVSLELAARGITVLSVDYQKALHGVHHPVPSDEVLAAWRTASTGDVWSAPPTSLHLGGASAGATLAAGVALRSAGDGGAVPASLALVYPLLHRTLPPASPAAAVAAAALPAELRFPSGFMGVINENFLGGTDPLAHPVAFPADGALASLPRTLVVSAEADDLRASGEAFAAQSAGAGVEVVQVVEPGTRHGYLDEPGHAAAVATIERVAAWVGR